MNLARQFAFYLVRWQMSTPILWLVVSQLGAGLGATVAANLIGGAIFFWIDRIIFGGRMDIEWELLANGACTDCGYTRPRPPPGLRARAFKAALRPPKRPEPAVPLRRLQRRQAAAPAQPGQHRERGLGVASYTPTRASRPSCFTKASRRSRVASHQSTLRGSMTPPER